VTTDADPEGFWPGFGAEKGVEQPSGKKVPAQKLNQLKRS